MLFREHCCHVCCAFGAGRNGQNGLFPFLLVEKAPHQPITKLNGKPLDLVAEEWGEVVGVTALVTVTETARAIASLES